MALILSMHLEKGPIRIINENTEEVITVKALRIGEDSVYLKVVANNNYMITGVDDKNSTPKQQLNAINKSIKITHIKTNTCVEMSISEGNWKSQKEQIRIAFFAPHCFRILRDGLNRTNPPPNAPKVIKRKKPHFVNNVATLR